MWIKISGFVATLVSVGSFFLSWGTTYGSHSNPLVSVQYTIQHTGKNAGPFGYITIGIASFAAILWLISFSSKVMRVAMAGQILASGIGASFVILALLTHPKIGWPIGPDLAIIGFIASVICAILVLRQTQEQNTPVSS